MLGKLSWLIQQASHDHSLSALTTNWRWRRCHYTVPGFPKEYITLFLCSNRSLDRLVIFVMIATVSNYMFDQTSITCVDMKFDWYYPVWTTNSISKTHIFYYLLWMSKFMSEYLLGVNGCVTRIHKSTILLLVSFPLLPTITLVIAYKEIVKTGPFVVITEVVFTTWKSRMMIVHPHRPLLPWLLCGNALASMWTDCQNPVWCMSAWDIQLMIALAGEPWPKEKLETVIMWK